MRLFGLALVQLVIYSYDSYAVFYIVVTYNLFQARVHFWLFSIIVSLNTVIIMTLVQFVLDNYKLMLNFLFIFLLLDIWWQCARRWLDQFLGIFNCLVISGDFLFAFCYCVVYLFVSISQLLHLLTNSQTLPVCNYHSLVQDLYVCIIFLL